MTINEYWSYGDEMAVAFSQKEREQIIYSLKEEARRCAVSVGVKKTTVDSLAQAAEISKGAFYSFYSSKEHLFLEILEDLHSEMYQSAIQEFSAHENSSQAERASKAIKAACSCLEASGMMTFMERDVHCILRKIPQDILNEHYYSDEVHICLCLKKAD